MPSAKQHAIIATNTTLDHSSIPAEQDEQGGLSGAPLRKKCPALVRAIVARSTIPVIACGGVMDCAGAGEQEKRRRQSDARAVLARREKLPSP